MLFFFQTLTSEDIVLRLVVSVSLSSLLEIQNLRPYPRPTESEQDPQCEPYEHSNLRRLLKTHLYTRQLGSKKPVDLPKVTWVNHGIIWVTDRNLCLQ